VGQKKKKQFQSIYRDEEDVLTAPGIEIHENPKPPKLEPIPDSGERRGTPRFKIEFETIIFCDGVSFRTRTINVSMSGALLAESVPVEFVDRHLDIVMIRYVGRVRDYYLVKGKALGAPLRSPRLQFTFLPDAQKKKLEILLENADRFYGG
jgi:hypothetical protein